MGIGKSIRVFMLAVLVTTICLGFIGCAGIGKSGVSKEDLVGYWHILDSGGEKTESVEESVGLYMLYRFDSDNTFTMETVIAGKSYARIGTYKIEGEKILVSVPAMKETSSGALSLHADALVDAALTLEKGVLSSNEISTDGKTTYAGKITEAEYKQLLGKSKTKANALGI